jgi:hypothetical protein
MRKYRNNPTIVDGVRFDSKGEAERWQELQFCEKSGEIKNLRRQVRVPLPVNGVKVATLVLDFMYDELGSDGKVHARAEDFKGMILPMFRLKAKMYKAIYGDDIIISGVVSKSPKWRVSRKKAPNR